MYLTCFSATQWTFLFETAAKRAISGLLFRVKVCGNAWYESVLMGGVWISLQYSVVLQAVQLLKHVFILKPLNACQSEREFNAIVFSWFVIYTLRASLYSVSFHNQLNVQPIDTREGVWHTAKGEFMSHMTQYVAKIAGIVWQSLTSDLSIHLS